MKCLQSFYREKASAGCEVRIIAPRKNPTLKKPTQLVQYSLCFLDIYRLGVILLSMLHPIVEAYMDESTVRIVRRAPQPSYQADLRSSLSEARLDWWDKCV